MIVPLFRRFARRTFANPPPVARVLALLVAVLAYGTTGFVYFEIKVKPEVGWLDGLWWAIVTVTTVGYGDMHPITPLGKFLGGIAAIMGIGLFALPTGILVSGFTEHIRNQKVPTTTQHCPHCGKEINSAV